MDLHRSPAISIEKAVSWVTFGMVWAAVLVIPLDLTLHLGKGAPPGVADVFDSTSEEGLSSFVAVTQTVLLALTLWLLAFLARSAGAARGRTAGWALLAAFFSYVAVDDGTRLHERIATSFSLSSMSESPIADAFPSYYWQLLLGPFFVIAGLGTLVFLWRELGGLRLRLRVLAGFALLAAAVGLDFLDGLPTGHPFDLYAHLAEGEGVRDAAALYFGLPAFDVVTHLSRSLEESLEIVGITMLWGAVLHQIPRLASSLAFHPAASPPPPAFQGDGAATGVPDMAPRPAAREV